MRRNLGRQVRVALGDRTISARAEEPVPRIGRSRAHRDHLRACGGTCNSSRCRRATCGPSPRVRRGTLDQNRRVMSDRGPSPRVRRNLRAGRGWQSIKRTISARGGTSPAIRSPLACVGPVKRQPNLTHLRHRKLTRCRSVQFVSCWCPAPGPLRACGGTTEVKEVAPFSKGPSPRVRRNQGRTRCTVSCGGTISARAEEPRPRVIVIRRDLDHLRACGGTQ